MQKIILGFFISFVFSISGHARDTSERIPNCWDSPSVVRGEYILGINTSKITKEQLLELMGLVNGKYILSRKFPIIIKDSMYIVVDALPTIIDDPKMKEVVEEELRFILGYEGTFMECNGLVRIQRH